MKKYTVILFSFILILSVFFGCVLQQNTPTGSVISAARYNPSSYVLHPKFKIFHENDSYSKLYVKLYTNELRFSSANKERINKSVIRVIYKIKESVNSDDYIDSAQTTITVKKVAGQTSVVSFFKIKDIEQDRYYIEIFIRDLYGNKNSLNYLSVNRSGDDNDQYYFSLVNRSSKPVFDDYFSRRDTFLIKYHNDTIKQMLVSYYNSNFEPAKRPHIIDKEDFNLTLDTLWKIEKKDQKFLFNEKKPGIYIIRGDSTKIRGMMKVMFKNEYPIISRSYQLTESLNYLLSDEEYQKMITADNKKLSVDNFWLQTTKNKQRAAELLKIWYNRATYANYYFTSYKEGWKTDRGMIYMVFGPPDDIKSLDDGEKWIYSNTKKDKTLQFIFFIQKNSISKNDYILERDPNYVSDWIDAVNSWRSGRVYRY